MRRGPLLAHEQQRRLGSAQQQRRRGAVGGRVDLVVQPFAEGAVADLVVVLEADDELRRHDAHAGSVPRGSSRWSDPGPVKNQPCMRSVVAMSGAVPRVVAVVALVVAGEQPPHLVVEVVGPHAVEAPAARLRRPHQAARLRWSSAISSTRRPGMRVAHRAVRLGEEVRRAVVVRARAWRRGGRPSTWYSCSQCSAFSMKNARTCSRPVAVEVDAGAPRRSMPRR